jgi:hypothetical protein
MRAATILWCVSLMTAPGAVVDRIAVTVGNDAITESEVLEEIRVTQFLNNAPLDFSADARRAAAERLVDQYLIRHELEAGTYPQPDAAQVAAVLQDFEKAHFHSHPEFAQKLKQYGITEDDVKGHLLFQLAALRFTDLRFDAGTQNEADRTSGGSTATDDGVDARLDSWLKQLRSQTRIEFKKEAFE